MVFLRQLIGQTAKRHRDRTWRSAAALKVINESGKNTLGTYNYKRQVTVSEWVVLKKILEFYGREKGYEGEGRHCEPWWQKTEAREQLIETLEDILAEARVRH